MIVLSAIVGTVQLLIALWMYGVCRRTPVAIIGFIFIGVLGMLFLAASFGGIGTFFQACALFAVAMVCLWFAANPGTYAKLAVAATLLVAAAVGTLNAMHWNRLVNKYPMVSLKDRLDYEVRLAKREVIAIPQADDTALKLKNELARLNDFYLASNGWNREALEQIHSSSVEKFVNSPGFGVGRMINPVQWLEHQEEPQPLVAEKPPMPAVSADQQAAAIPTESIEQTAESFRKVHRQAQSNFATSRGESLVQDIEHVAGFEPHGFSRDRSGSAFELQQAFDKRLVRLDLVSLLRHDPPRVYVSKELPDMKALDEVPTRALDAFETRALEELRTNPSELVADGVNGRVRLLGSILAVKRCQECHRVQEGDMLGAFSYELLPAEEPEPRKPKPESPDVL